MGYTTDFFGRFELDRPLREEHVTYLANFADTRRMLRDQNVTAGRPDPVREAVGLPVGLDGEFFVGEGGFKGQAEGADIIDYNRPPPSQPGLWCQWVPTADRKGIEWNGVEKFYNYGKWLQYICDNFLQRWGYSLNGQVDYQGESSDDRGTLYVINNRVSKNLSALEHLARALED